MLLGTDIDSALTTLEALPVDVIGLNCSTGPEYMRAPFQHLLEHSRLPLSVLPNAGLPVNVEGEAVYPMEPGPFSEMVADFAARGVNVVGGCCGTTRSIWRNWLPGYTARCVMADRCNCVPRSSAGRCARRRPPAP